jgi:DNA-directed RNA polymerase
MNKNNLVNMKDLFILVSFIKQIVMTDFEKIKKLTKYLKNIATILNILELPIVWNLPSGLTIRQSYMETKSTAITPFMYDKTKINIRVTIKDKYNKKKQVRALMPNLIHSLDGGSLCLLAIKFFNNYNVKPQFYSVHDCFGTTIDKIETLKTLLASVYTDIYSENVYLEKFDKSVLDYIENNTPGILDRENRTVFLQNTDLKNNLYKLYDID